jgi:hypothetical protein
LGPLFSSASYFIASTAIYFVAQNQIDAAVVRTIRFERHDLGNTWQRLLIDIEELGKNHPATKTLTRKLNAVLDATVGINCVLQDPTEETVEGIMSIARRTLPAVRRFLVHVGSRNDLTEETRTRLANRIIDAELSLQSISEATRPRQPEFSVVDLSELVRASLMGAAYNDKRGRPVSVKARISPKIMTEVDPWMIRQVLTNLQVDASIHPFAEGPIDLRVSVSRTSQGRAGAGCRVRFVSRGAAPLSAETARKIGRVMFTTSADRTEFHGLGKVGAAIVAEKHHGYFRAFNHRGSPALELVLPLRQPQSPPHSFGRAA